MTDSTKQWLYKFFNSINMISKSMLMKPERRLNTDRQKLVSRNKR